MQVKWNAENSNIIITPLLSDLKKLPTKRLLTYYRKYRSGRNFGKCGCCGEFRNTDNKNMNKVLNIYLNGVKSLLDNREHIECKN